MIPKGKGGKIPGPGGKGGGKGGGKAPRPGWLKKGLKEADKLSEKHKKV